jgi:hypothetical protein
MSAEFEHCVRVRFDPYNYAQVRNLIDAVQEDFPKKSFYNQSPHVKRWKYDFSSDGNPDVTVITFRFRNIEDAVMFGLKYSK